jgi:hypothetical protein
VVLLSSYHKYIWLCPEQQPLEGSRQTIQDPKKVLTIALNLLGFHLLDTLLKGRTLNAEYYRVTIFTELLPCRPQADGRKFTIHENNAGPYTARKQWAFCIENRLRLALHPPYSSDLAPQNFFLFGHCLEGMGFPTHEELLATIREIVAAIPK